MDDLTKVNDEPGHSATNAGDPPAALPPPLPAPHPYDDAADAWCAISKAVRQQRDVVKQKAADLNAADAKLAELAGQEKTAWSTLQGEREKADLPQAPPPEDGQD